MNFVKRGLCTLATLACLGFGTNALAVDTQELVDAGGIEIDPSFTLGNLHKDTKPNVASELGVVYGVMDGFNIGGGISFASLYGMNGWTAGLNVNAMITPVDTDNIDLDVRADFDWSLYEGYSLTPSIELNYDFEPDLAAWGLYMRFGLPIYGAGGLEMAFLDDVIGDDDDIEGADVGISLTLGAYYTYAENYQFLIEGGFDAVNLAENFGESGIEEAFLALGANITFSDSFELTTELRLFLPCDDDIDDDDEFRAALTIGGVFTMGGNNSASAGAEE